MVVCDNFVLNTSEILFLLLILTDILCLFLLIFFTLVFWADRTVENRDGGSILKKKGKIKQKSGFFCDTELLES